AAIIASGARQSHRKKGRKIGGSATRLLTFELGASHDGGRRLRELLLELTIGGTGRVLLAELRQGHAELQQAVRRLGAFGISRVALEERVGGVLVLALHVIGFAEPILGVARE